MTTDEAARNVLLELSASVPGRLRHAGFLAAMPRIAEVEHDLLPPLKPGAAIKLAKLTTEQKFTQTAPRYTEASLVL